MEKKDHSHRIESPQGHGQGGGGALCYPDKDGLKEGKNFSPEGRKWSDEVAVAGVRSSTAGGGGSFD